MISSNIVVSYLEARMTQTWWLVAIMTQVKAATGEASRKLFLAPST